ncbi:hypothetical protein C8Q75DRAFT_759187 [Abortiporus biennis]|nr:hypothetical protein C8Q75DRAFT_759187 [Abortiporus biennis]
MHFAAVFVALVLAPLYAMAAITITGPSETSYWVQNISNVITWTFTQGDPNPISIVITNSNSSLLNGNFSIAEFVDVSTQSFTVTNVTLRVADGYTVNFVNSSNLSDVFATGPSFSVKAGGTPAAPLANSTSAASISASAAGAAATTSASTSGAPTPTHINSGAIMNMNNAQNMFGLIVACGIASLGALIF